MARNSKKKPSQATMASKKANDTKKEQQNRREIIGIVFVVAALFAIICCFNTDAFLIGPFGTLISGLIGQFGRYLLPVMLVWSGLVLFRSKGRPVILRVSCILTLLITLPALLHILVELFSDEIQFDLVALYQGAPHWEGSGILSGSLAELLQLCLTKAGAIIVLILLITFQALRSVRITINGLITAIKKRPRIEKPEKKEAEEQDPAERLVNHVANKRIASYEKRHAIKDYDLPVDDPPFAEKKKKKEKKEAPVESPKPIDVEKNQVTIDEIELQDPILPELVLPMPAPEEEPAAEPVPTVAEPAAPAVPAAKPAEQPAEKLKKGEAAAAAAEISIEIEEKNQEAIPEYEFPSVSLLELRRQGMVDATSEMRENSVRLAEALKSFGIEPHIVNVIRGPAITRYELELDKGVKLSKITGLSEDIALALGASGVRISAIPDKISVVGIEVPNKAVNTVYAREVIDSAAFRNSKSRVSFAVGKDISGNCIVGDIAKLPHMLIAGTTGSGKSVCMNTLILSLLYKAKPDEVKMIMVDPKMVELGIYNGIPHLLIPVVTDPKKAAGALQWTVTEMMRRYRLMSDMGVRDLESYNKAVYADPDQQKMPQVVVVIDELADLMMAAAKEVEESICRIAQMGRASGIHLVIATQRPSADVITGLMKANIPSKIAFAVSSAMESRIILDTQGAEKLVGKGDMLFSPLGQGKPKRVQGCFVTDDEVQAVVAAIKAQSQSNYSSDIMEQIEKRAEQSGKGSSADASKSAPDEEEGDELLPAAVEVVLQTGQCSTSMLQRHLKLGYARAARIVDEMEERGIVGPLKGAKPRDVLVTREQWDQMQNGTYDPNPPVEEEIP
ncbi:MAG: DNA translocase FtsK [Oscillospiraceae bacterium]|nr:DNA translocase FtsK [Oscillospiraceae bacterium]